jgi:CHRD domain-containing protein
MNAALILPFTALGVLCLVAIQLSAAAAMAQSDSLIRQHLYIAKLTGDNTVPPVNTNTTGIAKFYAKYNNNELYYEINVTNIHNDVTTYTYTYR